MFPKPACVWKGPLSVCRSTSRSHPQPGPWRTPGCRRVFSPSRFHTGEVYRMRFRRGRSVASVALTENTLLSRRDLKGQTNVFPKQANTISKLKVHLDYKILRCVCGMIKTYDLYLCCPRCILLLGLKLGSTV